MKTAFVTIEGMTPYGQNKHYDKRSVPPSRENMTEADYEEESWRNRAHKDQDGIVFIPGIALKNAIDNAARYMGKKIAGQKMKTYTKKFEAGLIVVDNGHLGVKLDDIEGQWQFVPSNGKPGGGSRVNKCFPVIPAGWETTFELCVLDDIITEEVLLEHIECAGKFIGLGWWRPERRGNYGRFTVKKLDFAGNGSVS